MNNTLLLYSLQDIADRLRVHLNANPLDDIVEDAINELEEIILARMDDE